LLVEHQKFVGKDVERAFGVLQPYFIIIIICGHAWYMDKAELGVIMKACGILHNMIVEEEHDSYNLRMTMILWRIAPQSLMSDETIIRATQHTFIELYKFVTSNFMRISNRIHVKK